jgi:hypothetical protein
MTILARKEVTAPPEKPVADRDDDLAQLEAQWLSERDYTQDSNYF